MNTIPVGVMYAACEVQPSEGEGLEFGDTSRTENVLRKIPRNMGLSALMGMAVGVVSKRFVSDTLYSAGITFILMQCLNCMGYININWKKMENDLTGVFDQNKDGVLNEMDFRILLKRFLLRVSHGLSDIGSFTGGFCIGAWYLS